MPRKSRQPKDKGGRPTKLDVGQALVAYDTIRRGATRAEAAAACGVAESTFQDWLRRGRDGEEGFADLAEAIAAAPRRRRRRIRWREFLKETGFRSVGR